MSTHPPADPSAHPAGLAAPATRRRYLAAGLGLVATGATLGTAAIAAPRAGLATGGPRAGLAAQPAPPSATGSPGPTAPPGPGEPFALTARRTEINLPSVPALGLTYICRLDLIDEAGAPAGTAAAGATMIAVTVEGPVILAIVVLQLPDGDLHYQRIIDRFGAFPRTATGAILGGTGGYAGIGGEVDVSWPDEEQIELLVRPA